MNLGCLKTLGTGLVCRKIREEDTTLTGQSDGWPLTRGRMKRWHMAIDVAGWDLLGDVAYDVVGHVAKRISDTWLLTWHNGVLVMTWCWRGRWRCRWFADAMLKETTCCLRRHQPLTGIVLQRLTTTSFGMWDDLWGFGFRHRGRWHRRILLVATKWCFNFQRAGRRSETWTETKE